MKTSYRLQKDIIRSKPVSFYFNDQKIDAYEGESVAIALCLKGKNTLGFSYASHKPKSIFCAMGICGECLVQVDGKSIESCKLLVKENLKVYSCNYDD